MSQVMTYQQLEEKWIGADDKLNLKGLKENTSRYNTTLRLLDNQELQLKEDLNVTSQIKNYDPVVIKMVRRITPQLIAHDIVSVQPMTMPTGLGFALRARYPDASSPVDFTQGDEALFDKVKTEHSGTGTHGVVDVWGATDVLAQTGIGMETKVGETAKWKSMGVTIDRVELVAKTRQLRADYSNEIEKDLRAVHGLEASAELANILTSEIALEMNQELIRTLYHVALVGAQGTAAPGTFNFTTETDGRWLGERALGFAAFIEKEANRLALLNRRGRGNFIITSANVATVLALAGMLKNDHSLTTNMDVDIINSAYAGTMGRFKIFIDPLLSEDGILVGYKGQNEIDAGVIYAPYVPLQAYNGIDVVNGFKNAIGFQTRYAIASNPITKLEQNKNVYYSKFKVEGLQI